MTPAEELAALIAEAAEGSTFGPARITDAVEFYTALEEA